MYLNNKLKKNQLYKFAFHIDFSEGIGIWGLGISLNNNWYTLNYEKVATYEYNSYYGSIWNAGQEIKTNYGTKFEKGKLWMKVDTKTGSVSYGKAKNDWESLSLIPGSKGTAESMPLPYADMVLWLL